MFWEDEAENLKKKEKNARRARKRARAKKEKKNAEADAEESDAVTKKLKKRNIDDKTMPSSDDADDE
jgi:hypothetical protein